MWSSWQELAPMIYDRMVYGGNPLVAKVNSSGHRLLETPFADHEHFQRVLEIGAGTGEHLKYVRHGFREYTITDVSARMLSKARANHGNRAGVAFAQLDGASLPFADSSFDRLISVYTLEHLHMPHRVLREWMRVTKPSGTISISIPTEGGIAWNLGRWLTTRRAFKKLGLDLDYIIAREHVNACYKLVNLIRHYFPNRKDVWYPWRVIPSTNFNLIFSTNATNQK